jgi:4-amino-4-deoxy-L-arabinose transferase-like glycosyltransferase
VKGPPIIQIARESSMPKLSIQDAGVVLLTLTLLFTVLFWRLGDPTFWDPDEAHYAETTREMIATGDWWAAFYNEEPFFDKPMLFHQLQGLAMRAVSDPELGARLVPALAALGLVAVVAWLGSTLVAPRVGLLAALMLAANPGLFALSRYAILDTLFTLCLFGGCACLAVAALTGRRRLQWPGYIALALAVLVKGPLALVLCGLTFLILITVSAELRRRLLALRWMAGLTLAVALAAPWFIYMYLRFGDAFIKGYVLDENVKLFAAGRFANQPGYAFYIEILAVGLLPWTGLTIARLIDDVRDVVGGVRVDAVEAMLWAWTAAIVGFFTLSTFKLDHYVFPAAPALCLLTARAWDDMRPAARIGRQTVGPLLAAGGAATAYLLMVRLALPAGAMIVPAALVAAGAVLTVRLGRRPASPLAWLAIAPMIAVYAGVIVYALPALEARKAIPDIAAFVAAHARPSDRVAAYRLNRWTPAYRFYVGRHTTFLDDPDQAVAFFNDAQPFYAAMRRDGFDELVARGARLRVVYERDGAAVTSGRVLWRTPEPPVRYVVVAKR